MLLSHYDTAGFISDYTDIPTEEFYIKNDKLYLPLNDIESFLTAFYNEEAIAVPSGDLNTLRLVLEVITLDVIFIKPGLYSFKAYEVEL